MEAPTTGVPGGVELEDGEILEVEPVAAEPEGSKQAECEPKGVGWGERGVAAQPVGGDVGVRWESGSGGGSRVRRSAVGGEGVSEVGGG